jgi:hypothetical protein
LLVKKNNAERCAKGFWLLEFPIHRAYLPAGRANATYAPPVGPPRGALPPVA